MSHERLPEQPGSEPTPSQLDQRLVTIQRRLPLEAVAAPALGAASLPILYLSMMEYHGDDPKMLAAVIAFKLVCVAGTLGAMMGATLTGQQTYRDIRERSQILNYARERGRDVSGVVFKRVR